MELVNDKNKKFLLKNLNEQSGKNEQSTINKKSGKTKLYTPETTGIQLFILIY